MRRTLSHHALYRLCGHARPPACKGDIAEWSGGLISQPEVKTNVTLRQCWKCKALIAMFGERILWEIPLPKASDQG